MINYLHCTSTWKLQACSLKQFSKTVQTKVHSTDLKRCLRHKSKSGHCDLFDVHIWWLCCNKSSTQLQENNTSITMHALLILSFINIRLKSLNWNRYPEYALHACVYPLHQKNSKSAIFIWYMYENGHRQLLHVGVQSNTETERGSFRQSIRRGNNIFILLLFMAHAVALTEKNQKSKYMKDAWRIKIEDVLLSPNLTSINSIEVQSDLLDKT